MAKKKPAKKMGRPRKFAEGNRRQLTIYLDREMAIRVRILAAEQECSVSEVVAMALTEYLG